MTAPTRPDPQPPKPRFKLTAAEVAVFFPDRAKARARSSYAATLAITAHPANGRQVSGAKAGTPAAHLLGPRRAAAAAKAGTSRYRWVSYNSTNGKYVACVRSSYVGTYADEETAARRADRRALEIYGEAARPVLNFPGEPAEVKGA